MESIPVGEICWPGHWDFRNIMGVGHTNGSYELKSGNLELTGRCEELGLLIGSVFMDG